jgi:predicted TIM-barrel fold metal-dependent hydrolase
MPVYDHAEIGRALGAYRDRFAALGGGGSLNPMLHRYADPAAVDDGVRRAFASMARKIIDDGAVGFGEIASLHISVVRGHPYEFVPADHPLLRVLADVAAERDVPIDLHMDAASAPVAPPERFSKGANPPVLPETLAPFERLLAHSRKARIVWAHGGSDPVGAMTPSYIGRLMDSYPNLFVSLRVFGAAAPMHNKLLTSDGLDPAWRELLVRHADRFMIGSDSFFVAAGREHGGPGVTFARRNEPKLMATRRALSLLPPEVAVKIARDNAIRVYRLSEPP